MTFLFFYDNFHILTSLRSTVVVCPEASSHKIAATRSRTQSRRYSDSEQFRRQNKFRNGTLIINNYCYYYLVIFFFYNDKMIHRNNLNNNNNKTNILGWGEGVPPGYGNDARARVMLYSRTIQKDILLYK